MKIAITDILIEPRRREDMGDLAGLAKSIERYGLIHPIVIDDSGTLVAGERRLEACKRLGWTEVEVRSHGELTPEERHRMELEENVKRKDLTTGEIAKNWKALATITAEELREKDSSAVTADESSPAKPRTRGGQPKPDAQEKVAAELGIPQRTLSLNLAYAEAIETYPDLGSTVGIPMEDAIIMAKALNSLPEDARAQKVQALHEGHRGILADLRGLPPMPPPEPKPLDDQKTWSTGIKQLRQGLEKLSNDETLQGMTQKWSPEVATTQHDLLMSFVDRLKGVCQDIIRHGIGASHE